MKDSVNVLFVCGFGMGTSTMAELLVKKALKAENIRAEVKHTALGEMNAMKGWYDIVVTTTKFAEGIQFGPNEHSVIVVNVMDGPGIAKQIGKIVDEYYPEARG